MGNGRLVNAQLPVVRLRYAKSQYIFTMHVIRSVLYFSVRVLRFFIPQETMPVSPHPYIPALHRGKRDSSAQNLSDWAMAILVFHQSPDSVLEGQIVSVQWYKCRSGLEHEYPVFTLRNVGKLKCA